MANNFPKGLPWLLLSRFAQTLTPHCCVGLRGNRAIPIGACGDLCRRVALGCSPDWRRRIADCAGFFSVNVLSQYNTDNPASGGVFGMRKKSQLLGIHASPSTGLRWFYYLLPFV